MIQGGDFVNVGKTHLLCSLLLPLAECICVPIIYMSPFLTFMFAFLPGLHLSFNNEKNFGTQRNVGVETKEEGFRVALMKAACGRNTAQFVKIC